MTFREQKLKHHEKRNSIHQACHRILLTREMVDAKIFSQIMCSHLLSTKKNTLILLSNHMMCITIYDVQRYQPRKHKLTRDRLIGRKPVEVEPISKTTNPLMRSPSKQQLLANYYRALKCNSSTLHLAETLLSLVDAIVISANNIKATSQSRCMGKVCLT